MPSSCVRLARHHQSSSPNATPSERSPLLSKSNSRFLLNQSADQDDDDRLSIHQLVHRIRLDLLTLIDTPLSTEQLTSPAITFSITRPLEQTYFNLKNQAIIFALLVNRVQFITDSTHALTLHSVNATRATLCEILATNLLRRVHESDFIKEVSASSSPPPRSSLKPTVTQKLTPEEEEACLLKSANVLATAFSLFQGAPIEVIHSLESDWGARDAKNVLSRQSNALEMAIVSEAKQFIRSPACQRVIDAIWSGKIVYSSTAIMDIVSDRYKRRPVSLYNPRNAPLLNHYRLAVPRNRAALEYFHYFILILSYVLTLQTRQLNKMNGYEIWFNVFTIGFALDKLGSILEHGWLVFIANLWNGFDAAFIVGHFIYLALRISGLSYLKHYDLKSHWLNEQSHQVLSCLAIIIFPRLAFITLSDNILILSLRSMLSDFVFLMLLGAWCFLGFLYSLYSLQKGKLEAGEQAPYSLGEIAVWMVYIFFGLDATGISKADDFHPVLGPAIFVIYACLSNTLLVTVLVSILSKIFSDISADSIAETLYRKAVLTFEGVKSDALFSFQPPFNIPALLILFPLKPFLTPRKFHTVVVFLCRIFGCPVLLTISFFERYVVGPFDNKDQTRASLKLAVVNSLGGLARSPFSPFARVGGRKRTTMSKMSARISRNLRKFGGLAVINACFDYEPDPPVVPQSGVRMRAGLDGTQTVRGGAGDEEQATVRGKRGPRKAGGAQSRSHSQPGVRGRGGAELTALERLFMPQTGFISSLLHPRGFNPAAGMASKASSLASDAGDDDGREARPGAGQRQSSRPTIFLDAPPIVAHKPASIIQDEEAESGGRSSAPDRLVVDGRGLVSEIEERLEEFELSVERRVRELGEGAERVEGVLRELVRVVGEVREEMMRGKGNGDVE